jgi:NitT/TauT family transport system substrate-binding protein
MHSRIVSTLRYVAAILVPALFGVPTIAAATDENATTPVVLAVDGINMVRNLPVLLAERLGYFRDERLQVTLKETSAGADIDRQLADGTITGMVAYYHHTIVAQVDEGIPAVAVVALAVTPGYKVLLAPALADHVKSAADLKGRRIISGGPHSAKTTAANWIILHAGMALTDYTRLSTGDKAQIAAQLRNGEADAVIAPEPDASAYVAQGVGTPFLDLYSLDGTEHAVGSAFPTSVLYMSAHYVETHAELTQRLVNAFVRTLRYLGLHDADDIAQIVPEMKTGANRAPAVLREGVKMFATDGRMPAEAARAEAAVIAAQFPAYRAAKIEQTFDNRFVDHALTP